MRKARHSVDYISQLQVNLDLSLEEQIAQRAREIWSERGQVHGDDWRDWFRAEAEIDEWHKHRLRKMRG